MKKKKSNELTVISTTCTDRTDLDIGGY